MALTGYEAIETDLGVFTAADGPQEFTLNAPAGKRFLSVSATTTGFMGTTPPPRVVPGGSAVTWNFSPQGGLYGGEPNLVKVYTVAADVAPEEE